MNAHVSVYFFSFLQFIRVNVLGKICELKSEIDLSISQLVVECRGCAGWMDGWMVGQVRNS